jgi:rhodanese-related sulfurtransferase
LKQAGVKDARALTGGFAAWVAAKQPVVSGKSPK